jgi:hypothetical protein
VRPLVPALLVGLLALGACGRPSAPAPGSQRGSPGLTPLVAEAEAAFQLGQWERAARAYEQALVYAPQDLGLRYRAGVAWAHADRVEQAATAFFWVVDHGQPTQEEVRLARQWLVQAGFAPGPEASRANPGGPEEPRALGGLRGRTAWPDLEPDRPRPNLQILLEGAEAATRGRRYWAKVPLTASYEVPGIVPGRYRVMAQVGPIRLWETQVEIRAGEPTVLDLTPATSVAPADALRIR